MASHRLVLSTNPAKAADAVEAALEHSAACEALSEALQADVSLRLESELSWLASHMQATDNAIVAAISAFIACVWLPGGNASHEDAQERTVLGVSAARAAFIAALQADARDVGG